MVKKEEILSKHPKRFEPLAKCDKDFVWSNAFNLNMLGERRINNLSHDPMLDFGSLAGGEATNINAQMLDFERGHSKDYYRQLFPGVSDEICTLFEWYSCGQWNEIRMLLKVRQREEKLRRRREHKKKLKQMGTQYNAKKAKMKKIRKKVQVAFP